MKKNHFIHGKWLDGQGTQFSTTSPATGDALYTGRFATDEELNQSVYAALHALSSWADFPVEKRIEIIENYAKQLTLQKDHLATTIAQETGKPLWESKTEVSAMIAKIAVSLTAYQQRTGVMTTELPYGSQVTRHKPIGVIGILGPFNFPAHLPNGQIVPALLAGNTIVFKPSPYAPMTAVALLSCWQEAGLPPGTLNLIQGDGQLGEKLATHFLLNGLFFTGSYAVGSRLHQLFAGKPEKLLMLEMGGNNPLIAFEIKDITAAAYYTVQSAFITAGQRCSCARRLIIPAGSAGDALLDKLMQLMQQLRVGVYTDEPEPFMGPVISSVVAEKLLAAQANLIAKGARALMPMRHLRENTGLISPGLLDVTAVDEVIDEEYFGPLLQVTRVKNFAGAIAKANNTAYGLTAALLSDNPDLYQTFYKEIKAGIINWNRPTTGAAGLAPFGGIGHSGNFRPGGFYTADSCAYPVAGVEAPNLQLPEQITPGIVLES